MSDPVQMPPSTPFTPPRVTPVHVADPVEPATKPQSDNRSAGDHKPGSDRPSTQTSAADRHLTITREPALQSFVYRSIESDSGEVVWQYPAEQVLRRARTLRELEERHRREVAEKS